MQFILFVMIIFSYGVLNTLAINTRLFNNPFNENNLDLVILVDETPSSVSSSSHSSLRTAVGGVIERLTSIRFARFGIAFYGASDSLRWPVNMWTNYSSVIKTNLDNFRPTPMGLSGGMVLADAINTVHQRWNTSKRDNTPNVLVILTSNIDLALESKIRQIESELLLTVIIVGIGSTVLKADLDKLVTAPSSSFALTFDNFRELFSLPYELPDIISDVPKPTKPNSVTNITAALIGSPNILMIPIEQRASGDSIIAIHVDCRNCSVYASLNALIPTSNEVLATKSSYSISTPSISNVYHFLVPSSARRLFVNIEANLNNIPLSARYFSFLIPDLLS